MVVSMDRLDRTAGNRDAADRMLQLMFGSAEPAQWRTTGPEAKRAIAQRLLESRPTALHLWQRVAAAVAANNGNGRTAFDATRVAQFVEALNTRPYDGMFQVWHGRTDIVVPHELAIAILLKETTRFDAKAKVRRDGHGLMQVNRTTLLERDFWALLQRYQLVAGPFDPKLSQAEVEQILFDPTTNVLVGILYLRELMARLVARVLDPRERAKFLLMMYNTGPGWTLGFYDERAPGAPVGGALQTANRYRVALVFEDVVSKTIQWPPAPPPPAKGTKRRTPKTSTPPPRYVPVYLIPTQTLLDGKLIWTQMTRAAYEGGMDYTRTGWATFQVLLQLTHPFAPQAGLEEPAEKIVDLFAVVDAAEKRLATPRLLVWRLGLGRPTHLWTDYDVDASTPANALMVKAGEIGHSSDRARTQAVRTICGRCAFLIVYDARTRSMLYAHSNYGDVSPLERELKAVAQWSAEERQGLTVYLGGLGRTAYQREPDRALDEAAMIQKILEVRARLTRLAEQAGAQVALAFPEHVGVGVDTVFDRPSGRLFIQELFFGGRSPVPIPNNEKPTFAEYLDWLRPSAGPRPRPPQGGLEERMPGWMQQIVPTGTLPNMVTRVHAQAAATPKIAVLFDPSLLIGWAGKDAADRLMWQTTLAAQTQHALGLREAADLQLGTPEEAARYRAEGYRVIVVTRAADSLDGPLPASAPPLVVARAIAAAHDQRENPATLSILVDDYLPVSAVPLTDVLARMTDLFA
ncbi:MAG: hypothetical protein A3C53_05240 [Omnitrophica WOR_2 bacterium RIFCSPHIGHO2_02_FULL_68_15]|nr:MAG: hypothetical protein A3C53_05240 [Omnitrophica WOR_2 bacterium RIFCSPHIGHO2_02_FULL_68_15]